MTTYFEIIEKLVSEMKLQGLSLEAAKLSELVESSVSALELIMGAKYILRKIDRSRLPEGLRSEITELLKIIDSSLT